jgi:hypothetical protein
MSEEKDPVALALDRLSGKESFSLTGEKVERQIIKPEGGFLWKPKGENSGSLVVLMPQAYREQVRGVSLMTKAGQVVERGKSSGYANGGREHFRFSRAGGSYPKNLLVEVEFSSGQKKYIPISDPASRVQ